MGQSPRNQAQNNASIFPHSPTPNFHVRVSQLTYAGVLDESLRFLLIILLLLAWRKDHSPCQESLFLCAPFQPGLPAEAAPWRATLLPESIKAQLPGAEWPRCLAKGGRMLLSLPGSGLLYQPSRLTSLYQFNRIKSSTRGEGRVAARGKAARRPLRKLTVPA